MATKYASSLATGTGTGTFAAPWTLAQLVSGMSGGDVGYLIADGTYTVSATWAPPAGPDTAHWTKVSGCNSSGVEDGTKATIQATAASFAILGLTNDFVKARNLVLDGNNQTGSIGLKLAGTYMHATRVKAINCKGFAGIWSTGGNNQFFSRCEASGCSASFGISLQNAKAFFCDSHGNTCSGFEMGNNSSAVYCKAYANSGTSDGFNCTSVGYTADHCTAYNNGRYGFDLTGNAGFGAFLANCISYGNTTQDYGTDAVKDGAELLNCAGRAGAASGSGIGFITGNLPTNDGYVTLTASPFTSAGTGDFSLNNTAGGGAACRAAGFPGVCPDGTTTGYVDLGAAQHQDSGGGGSGLPLTFLHSGGRRVI